MGIRLLPICAFIFRMTERVLEIYFNNGKKQRVQIGVTIYKTVSYFGQ